MKNPDVIVREVDDGAVLLHMADGIYFGLDPLGLQFWNLLESDRTMAEIVDLLVQKYDVSKQQLELDLSALLADLTAKGLIKE